MIYFSDLHYNVIRPPHDAISGGNYKIVSQTWRIIMQMSPVNYEKAAKQLLATLIFF